MADLQSRGEPFVLATVISRNGSAPRSAGARMLIRADGSTSGTVGGGILEARVQRLAAEVMVNHTAVIQGFSFTGKDASTMDSICGGQVEVLVEWLDSKDPALAEVIMGLQEAASHHLKAWLVTCLPARSSSPLHALVHPDGRVTGCLPPGLSTDTVVAIRHPDLVHFGQQQAMIDPVNINGTAYVFGAGHVSRSLAEFTASVGFWTVVLDDRPEFANPQRFPLADQLVVLDSFSDALAKVEIDRDSYVVIVTRGHLNDRAVLEHVLKTEAGYIGMIGSRRKCELIFQELRKEGFSDEDIRRVHAPIGLPIDAETPEEIGVSIVAEMIRDRAKRNQ